MGTVTSMAQRLGSALRNDSWYNSVLGFGTTRDPSKNTKITKRAPLNHEALDAMYAQDHVAARIVEALPREGLRAGHDLISKGEVSKAAKLRDAYDEYERAIGVQLAFREGAFWGRLYGGAVTWIGADDGLDPRLELDVNKIESIKFLHTFDRWDVHVAAYYTEAKHPKFQQPKLYRITPRVWRGGQEGPDDRGTTGTPIEVHETRCLRWPGAPTTDRRRPELSGWDDSVLERAWNALRQSTEDYAAKSNALNRASQSVYKLLGFIEAVAGKREDELRARLSLIDQTRSATRAVVLDPGDTYEQHNTNFSGFDSLIQLGDQRLAAAAGMPLSVLHGQVLSTNDGPSGGDMEVWATQVDAWREQVLRPLHERVATLILLAKDGPTKGKPPTEEWAIQYRPTRVPSPRESAEITKLQAEADALRIDKGMAHPEEIAAQRFNPSAGGDIVLGEEQLKEAVERRRKVSGKATKDNAELGTLAARGDKLLDINERVNSGQMSREVAVAHLTQVWGYESKVAEQLVDKKSFAAKRAPQSPGPDPKPGSGQGAGAPPGLGDNAGGNPKEPKTPEVTVPRSADEITNQ